MKYQRMIVTIVAMIGLTYACGEDKKNVSPLQQMVSDNAVTWTSHAALTGAANCGDAETSFKAMLRSSMLMQLEQQRKYYVDYRSNQSKYADEMDAGLAEPSAAEAGSMDSNAQSAEEYSDTNVQVEGVDEADLVKTDGNMIYTLSGNELVVVDAWPPEQMHETARLEIKGSPYAMYRHDNRLVVLSSSNVSSLSDPETQSESKNDPYYYSGYYWQPIAVVTIVDVSDPEAPVVESEAAYEGNTLSTRRIGRHLYLVLRNHLYGVTNKLEYWPDVEWGAPVEEIDQAFVKLANKNIAVINSLDLKDFQSFSYKFGKDGHLKVDTALPLAECGSVFTPNVFSGFGTVSAITVDLDGELAVQGSSVIGDWGTVYASLNSLYVASTNWSWWWWYADDDRPDIVTHVHKFSYVQDSGVALYNASGSVPGYVLNQFSMDEFESNLRVATTLPDWWWWGDDGENQSESYVTVLEQKGGQLKQVGQVSGLGMGEQIYSVRFIKDRGYVVTFRQIDPLYVIDLSDPKNPEVAGELKIPGYSSYMHPIDDTHLLTVGRDGTEEGQILGLSFQIFDVSDPADPRQIAKTVLNDSKWGWMWSEAEWDHHAFVYFASRGLLAIPVQGWSYEETDDGWYSYGTYHSQLELFQVSITDGVVPLGNVSHMDMLGQLPEPEYDYCWGSFGWWYNSKTHIRRGIFMDDYLYSLSAAGLKVNYSTDLQAGPVAQVQLVQPENLLEDFLNSYGYCWGDDW